MLPILYVDNDDSYRTEFTKLMQSHGYKVQSVEGPVYALEYLSNNKYDIVITELEFETFGGFRLLESVKKIAPHTKRVVLTIDDNPKSEIEALENHIDLYLLKSRGKQLAINSIEILKMEIEEAGNKNIYLVGDGCDLRINLLNHEVIVRGEVIHLTPIELEILKLLLNNKNEYFTREKIIEKVWGVKGNSSPRVVDTHIKKIRKKTNCHSIVTVRGYGYMWHD